MRDTSLHPLRMTLEKFWAPVPWMLEAAIVLEVALGKYVKAAIVVGLLVLNAAPGLYHESRTQATLAALKSRLALNASVRRDGAWKTVQAAELVPGDLVKLSLGAIVAADVKLTAGTLAAAAVLAVILDLSYDIDLTCPRCGLEGKVSEGKVSVEGGTPFTVEKLPPYFRVMQLSDQRREIKLACRSGEVFDLSGHQQRL